MEIALRSLKNAVKNREHDTQAHLSLQEDKDNKNIIPKN